MDAATRPLFEWLGCWLGVQTGEMVDAFRWIGDPWQPNDLYEEFFLVNTDQTDDNRALGLRQSSASFSRLRSALFPTGDAFWQKGYQASGPSRV